MSISTKTGDEGKTHLLFGKRVDKDDPRVIAYGTIDELSATIALTETSLSPKEEPLRDSLQKIRRELVFLMTELATQDTDQPRLTLPKFPCLTEEHLHWLEEQITTLEKPQKPFNWTYTPPKEGFLHLARTICRRAEREIISLKKTGATVRPLLLQYTNRLSDLLFILASS